MLNLKKYICKFRTQWVLEDLISLKPLLFACFVIGGIPWVRGSVGFFRLDFCRQENPRLFFLHRWAKPVGDPFPSFEWFPGPSGWLKPLKDSFVLGLGSGLGRLGLDPNFIYSALSLVYGSWYQTQPISFTTRFGGHALRGAHSKSAPCGGRDAPS